MDRNEIKITFFKSGGPGGQHKNKRETAVRVKHLPTGLEAVSQEERSQHQNLRLALKRLEERLARFRKKKKKRIPMSKSGSVKRRILEDKRHKAKLKSQRSENRHVERSNETY